MARADERRADRGGPTSDPDRFSAELAWRVAGIVGHQCAVHRSNRVGVHSVGQGDRGLHRRGVSDNQGRVLLGFSAGQLGLADCAC